MPATKPSPTEAENAATETIGGYGLGAVPDPVDRRNYLIASAAAPLDETRAFRSVTAPDTSLPFGCRIRDMAPIWDQGRLGSCVPHAVDRLIAYARRKQGLPYVEPSHLYTYWWARYLYGGIPTTLKDTGSASSLALRSTRQQGAPPKDAWPYDIARFAERPPASADTAAELHQSIESWSIPDGDIAAVQACLAEGWPVTFGVPIFTNFTADAETGYVPVPSGSIRGYHELVIRNWRPWDDGYFGIENSWSTAWGRRGRAFFPVQYIAEHAFDMWSVRSVEQAALPS